MAEPLSTLNWKYYYFILISDMSTRMKYPDLGMAILKSYLLSANTFNSYSLWF